MWLALALDLRNENLVIFAELETNADYASTDPELAAFLRVHFSKVESGLQGDSWIWILDGEIRVEVDTFTSMKHQIKSAKAGQHVHKVIEALQKKYKVTVYQAPALEAHEDA